MNGDTNKGIFLLVHGWATDSHVWDGFVEHLPAGWDVVRVDLPGHGGGCEWEEPTLRPGMEAVVKTLQGMEGRSTVAVGWSLGGQVLLKTILEEPYLFDRLVLISTTPCFTKRADFPHAQPRGVVRRMIRDMRLNPSDTVRRFYGLNFTPEEMRLKGVDEFIRRYTSLSIDHRGLIPPLEALYRIDLRDDLTRISLPTLVIHGDMDGVCPVSAGIYLGERIKGAEVKILRNTAHAPFITRSSEVAGLIRGFCSSEKPLLKRGFNPEGLNPFPKNLRSGFPCKGDFKASKEVIKRSFSRAVDSYDSNAHLQKDVARKVVELALGYMEREEQRVLDAGCGTGMVSMFLRERTPGVRLFGCDIAQPLLLKARQRGVTAITGDCEYLPLRDSTVDMVVSNLTYQWVGELTGAFVDTRRVLRKGGVFVFSTLGAHTLRELFTSIKKAQIRTGMDGLPEPMVFRTREYIVKEIERAGLRPIHVERDRVTRTYRDLFELLKVLKSIGAVNPYRGGNNSLAKGSILRHVAWVYREMFPSEDGGIRTTYDVIFMVARKE